MSQQSHVVGVSNNSSPEPSLRVFRRHLYSGMLGANEEPTLGAEMHPRNVVSRECYEDWLTTRPAYPQDPQRTFQRCLTAHIGGTDGREFGFWFPFVLAKPKKQLPLFQHVVIYINSIVAIWTDRRTPPNTRAHVKNRPTIQARGRKSRAENRAAKETVACL